MDPIIETGAAAVFAGYVVALFKLASPRAPSWALVTLATLAGVACSAVVVIAGGGMEPLSDAQGVAQTILQGIGAAVAAAGLTRTDSAGEERREDVGATAMRTGRAPRQDMT